jgi:hypothetical protein
MNGNGRAGDGASPGEAEVRGTSAKTSGKSDIGAPSQTSIVFISSQPLQPISELERDFKMPKGAISFVPAKHFS